MQNKCIAKPYKDKILNVCFKKNKWILCSWYYKDGKKMNAKDGKYCCICGEEVEYAE